MGFRQSRFFLRPLWRAGKGSGVSRREVFGVSFSSGFADHVYHIAAGHNRTWACQSSLRQFFLGGLLVPDRATRHFSVSSTVGATESAALSCWGAADYCEM